TSALLSWSLDYPASFERLAQLSVPFLGDLCLIDILADGEIRRMCAVHADPAKAELANRLVALPPRPFGSHPIASVLQGGAAIVHDELPDGFLRAMSRDDEHFAILKALEFTSFVCVPLTARGNTIGALTLVSAGSGRRFGSHDLELAEELGRRAGLAIDNARLYSERDYVARALQSSLLPPSLPDIPGVRYAARYQAAGRGTEVGGDFYDVFRSGRNAWWFVIGDVSGKGPRAASIAGLARHTLHGVAMDRGTPRRSLSALHGTLATAEGQGEYCTVCCGLLRPATNSVPARLTVASAGHPPPIIRRADGSTEVAGCRGPLLGVPLRNVKFEQQVLRLDPGDTFVFYTDGVTEAHRRGEPLFGEERLTATIAQAAGDVDAIADAIVEAVAKYGPADLHDDLAVLVVQIASGAANADVAP
ncbi:MAG TPA: GAF domain-containing SpoIIE family protein phosphatase, partial [Acidimicrobiia bacterium]|nr:GAF domain-containing SpoIIE family protein phosphatase [Acidimicrobiia bacterium]